MARKTNSLTEQAYTAIKKLIITNQLPPGELINESQLQEVLNIGRTPVHEALLRLSYERLVTVIPRKGIEVSRLSPKVVNDIFQARILIEPMALRYGIHNLDKKWVAEMRETFTKVHEDHLLDEQQGIINYLEQDMKFHSTLIRSLNNEYINTLVDMYLNQLTMITIATTQKSTLADHANLGHIEMIDHILNDEVDLACETLRRHLEECHKDVILNYLNM